MYLEHEFEYVINHAGHPIGYVEGQAVLHAWGMIDFDWKISEVWLRDADSRKLFKIDPETSLGKEITEWLYQREADRIEEHIVLEA